jgi:putative flavoprotein involved in K+ transport
MRRRGNVPTIDVGMVAQLRAGKVEVVPAVTGFQGAEVQLSDGRVLRPDAVIAATGYRDGAADLLDAGSPSGGTRATGSMRRSLAPGLFAVGLTESQKGLLFQINLDSRRVARAIARQVRHHDA